MHNSTQASSYGCLKLKKLRKMSHEFNVYIRECKPLLHLSLMNESCISINQYIASILLQSVVIGMVWRLPYVVWSFYSCSLALPKLEEMAYSRDLSWEVVPLSSSLSSDDGVWLGQVTQPYLKPNSTLKQLNLADKHFWYLFLFLTISQSAKTHKALIS